MRNSSFESMSVMVALYEDLSVTLNLLIVFPLTNDKMINFYFFEILSDLKQYLITSQTRVKRVSRIHHQTIFVVYPANAFDSCLRGD